MVLQRQTDCVRTVLTRYAFFARLAGHVQNVPLQSRERAVPGSTRFPIAERNAVKPLATGAGVPGLSVFDHG